MASIEMAALGHDGMFHTINSNGVILCSMGRKADLTGHAVYAFDPVNCLTCILLVADGRRPFLVEDSTLIP